MTGSGSEDNPGADPSEVQVILPMEEFAEDLDVRLGRANGNIYHRRPGVEGVHDGQVMVRLKKKRFIIIDYSIVPTEADLAAAEVSPQISCPSGAGKQKCHTPECTKVGVPVSLYDSDPNEPTSLYLRSGLCFTCQRNLNEKRRTQRKRASDIGPSSVLYAVGPGQKKVKLNGQSIELESDAIILNGPPIDGAKSVRDGYSFHEIGIDLSNNLSSAVRDTERLVNAVSSNTTTTTASNGDGNSGESVADMAARAAAAVNVMSTEEAATNAAVDVAVEASNSEDIPALYDKAFNSLSKSIYLLSQWKQSWDSVIAAAVAQETVADQSLVDAVASAAAVAAAAASDGQDNMASLLLAADQRKDGSAKQEQGNDVQQFEV
eukprot:scaffold672_cov126-Cylindrotheca_fusiformis.AAC.28